MFPANLLLLMVLLLPQASSGRQGEDTSELTHGRVPSPAPAPIPGHPSLAQTIQSLLLTRLGLQSRPDPGPGVPVPQYLLDLYRFHQQEYHLVEDPFFSFPSQHVQQANTIRSFHHTEPPEKWSPTAEDYRRVHISFNVSTIPQDERVVSAELRVLCSSRDSSGSHGAHRVTLYLSENHQDPSPTLLETRLLSVGLHRNRANSGWETFSLNAELLRKALLAGTGGLGFLLEVSPENGTTALLSDPSLSSSVAEEEEEEAAAVAKEKALRDGHLRVRRSSRQEDHSWAQERPLLVTYSHDGHGEALVTHGRTSSAGQRMRGRKGTKGRERSSGSSQGWGRPRKRGHEGGVSWSKRGRVKRNGGRATKLKRLSRARCRRHPLYVDFNDVGWHKWIIAPSGYDAFFCLGECRFPLADHMNSSSHAMVQTLVNSVNGAVPRACCVPTALSPIALLYLDSQDRVVLKNYQDMVVEGCGCR